MLKTEKYFAAMNTSGGFISCFDKIFDPAKFDTLYVIKGGPGTGKSSMMRRTAEAAEKKGHKVCYYYCSSDPGSLDGIVIPSLSFGMLDGTSPHLTDPKYPGAADILFDFYPFFDAAKLKKRRDDIISLTDKCSLLHKKSSSYRGYAGAAAREALNIVSSCVDGEKMTAAARREAEQIKGAAGGAEHRQISAFSAKGKITLDTFEKAAEKTVGVCDEHGSAYLFMNKLKEELKKKNVSFFYSLDTLLPENCEAVFLPDACVYYRVTGRMADTDRNGFAKLINMKRFVRADKLKDVRKRLRICENIKNTLGEQSERLIREAGAAHDRLEAIYKTAVDFDGVKAETDGIIKALLKG